MPGIADNPTVAINTSPLAAIGSEQSTAPAVNDFMKAFRDGFITVDDITRRTKQSAIDTSNMRTTISANDLTQRKQASELQLLPGQVAEAQTQQEIQATTAPARLGMAQEQADKFARYQADPQKFLAEESDRQVEATYINTKGRLPEVLLVKNPEKPLPFSDWLEVRNAENAENQFSNDVSDTQLAVEYQTYKRSQEKVAVRKGSPEYADALREEVNTLAEKAIIKSAQAKALPGILEKRAVGGTPHNTKVTRLNKETGLEEEVLVATDSQTGEILNETILATNSPKLTEVQSNATIFSTRMAQNDKTLTALEQRGFDPSALSTTTQKFLPNRFKSDEVQSYTAAKDNWISAILRKESGAAISAQEYTQANKEYFPRDGDSPAVVRQKQDLRKVAEEQVRKAGGAGTAAAVPATSAASSAPSAGAKRVIQNGVTFEWNGTTYVPVQ